MNPPIKSSILFIYAKCIIQNLTNKTSKINGYIEINQL